MKKLLIVAAAVCLSAFPAWADITVAVVGPLTGSMAAFGEQMKGGAEQAVADINAKGGIKGQKIVLRMADDACDPKQAVTVANKMASEGVKFVVGHLCSGASIPASKVYNEEGILMISPGTSNPAFTQAGFDNVFRTYESDDDDGGILAHYLLRHFHGDNIAVIHDNSTYGHGVADIVRKGLNAGGVKEVLFDSYTPGERDYSSLISKLKQAHTQVAMIGGYHTEIGLIVRQMKEQGAHIQVVAGGSLATDEFWQIAGPASDGVLMSFAPDPRKQPETEAVIKRMRQNGYDPEGYAFNTYAAIEALAEGITRAGKADPALVTKALKQGPIKTVLGPIGFTAKGDVTGLIPVMYRWANGKYTEISE